MLKPESLHLWLYTYNFELVLTSPVISLDLEWPDGEEEDPSLHDLYTIYSIPTLRTLCLTGATHQGVTNESLPSGNESAFSNVSSLTLQHSGLGGNVMEKLLTWPKRLQHCGYLTGSDSNGMRPGAYRSLAAYTGLDMLLRALTPHKETLQSLTYYNGNYYDDSTFGKALQGFKSLRRLDTTQNYLATLYRYRTPPRVHEILPASIEILRLDQVEALMSQTFRHDTEYQERLRLWLQEIMECKPQAFPRLKEITIWQDQTADKEDDSRGRMEITTIYNRLWVFLYRFYH